MTFEGAAEPTPAHALAMMFTGYEHLVKILADGGAEALDDSGLIGFMQDFERFRNQLSVVDHLMIADGVRRDLSTSLCQRSMSRC